MNTIILRIYRKITFIGMEKPYAIKIDGIKKGSVKNGGSIEIEIPNSNCVLTVDVYGNFMTFHKMKREVVIFPEHCKNGIIACYINTRINWLGCMTCGILQASGTISIDLNYNAK